MRENKAARILNLIFNIIFLITFGALFIFILSEGYVNEKLNYGAHERGIIILCAASLTAAFSLIYCFINRFNFAGLSKRRLNRYKAEANKDRQTKIIIFSGVAFMLIIQIFIGFKLKMQPVTDLEILNNYAYDFAKTGGFDKIGEDYSNGYVYMIRYPNNFAILFVLSFLYRIGYLIFGYIPAYLPVFFNTLMINLSVLFTVLCARLVYGNRKSLMTLLLCFVFMPYYTYLPYYYTDSISMPFGMCALYLFLCAVYKGNSSRAKKAVLLASAGVLLFAGFKLKASVAVFLVAVIIYTFLKFGIKQTACILLAVLAGFGGAAAIYTSAFNASQIVTREQQDSAQYPYTHWVMMGLKGLGHYNLKDSNYTESFDTIEEKQDANIKVIKERLEKMGPDGLFEHLKNKAVWTWEDGTYYISHHIENPVKKSVLHSYILDEGENHLVFYVYSCAFQLFMMFMIIVNIIKDIFKNEIGINTLLKGIVFAIFVFLLVWETRSRYLYNFTPVFLLLSVSGLDITTGFFSGAVRRVKGLRG